MSTGHPGICYHVDGCLRRDGKMGWSVQIAGIHVGEKVSPETFWASYDQMFRHLPCANKIMPIVITTVVRDRVHMAMTLAFPIYDEDGQTSSMKDLPVIFTELPEKYNPCATVDKEGRVVGEGTPQGAIAA